MHQFITVGETSVHQNPPETRSVGFSRRIYFEEGQAESVKQRSHSDSFTFKKKDQSMKNTMPTCWTGSTTIWNKNDLFGQERSVVVDFNVIKLLGGKWFCSHDEIMSQLQVYLYDFVKSFH